MASAVAVLDAPEVQDVQKQDGESTTLKRLNINLTSGVFDEVQDLSKRSNKSMTELVRVGLGLMKIAHEAHKSGYKLAVVNEEGKPLKEILIV